MPVENLRNLRTDAVNKPGDDEFRAAARSPSLDDPRADLPIPRKALTHLRLFGTTPRTS